jgi:asparaginyl-tRNA synthetase
MIGGKQTLQNSIPKSLEELSELELEKRICTGRIATQALKILTDEYLAEGFEWLLPVVLSKTTDPLWPDTSIEKRVEVEIYGERVNAMLSMIVHKVVACSLAYPKLFTLSPNIRIEMRERSITGVHAYEFTQLDFESRETTSEEVRGFVERALCGLIEDLRRKRKEELERLGRYDALKLPERPFKVHDREELLAKYGDGWEGEVKKFEEPVWVVNMPRQFYDFEDFETGKWDNFDLILPGLGEALSGSKREYQYEKLVEKIKRDGIRKENFSVMLKMAEEGRLKSTVGAGIGLERLLSWIVGAEHIGEVQPFPKVPGIVNDL